MFGFGKNKDQQGIRLIRAGHLEDALRHFTDRLQNDPENADILIEIGKIHFKQGNIGLAKEFLSKAAENELDQESIRQILDMTNFKKLASDRFLNSHPSFSPDGKWVAFSSARRSSSEDGKIHVYDRPGIYAVHVDTASEIQVVPDDFYNSQPVFSPDGERIAYLSAREDSNQDGVLNHTDNPGLYLRELSSGEEVLLAEPRYRAKFPSFSPDGEWVLFCAWMKPGGVCGVYLCHVKTRTIQPVQQVFESNFPLFSPDGTKVLYSSWRRDSNGDGLINLTDNSAIYEYDLKTETETCLVPDNYSSSYAHYSPNGQDIIYLSRRRDTNNDGVINSLDNSGIYLLQLSKLKERTVMNDAHYNKFPAFSCDGEHVVFLGAWRSAPAPGSARSIDHSEYFKNKGIHIADLSGRNEREIVSTKHYGCRFLCPSPTENRVVYVSWRKDTNRGLYVAPFDRLPSRDEVKEYIQTNL